MKYEKYKRGRFWAVYKDGHLVSICVYKRGAIATIKLFLELQGFGDEQIAEYLRNAEIAYKNAG